MYPVPDCHRSLKWPASYATYRDTIDSIRRTMPRSFRPARLETCHHTTVFRYRTPLDLINRLKPPQRVSVLLSPLAGADPRGFLTTVPLCVDIEQLP